MFNTICLGAGMLLFLVVLLRRKASSHKPPAVEPAATHTRRIPSKPQNVGLPRFTRSPALSRSHTGNTVTFDRR